MKLTSSQIDQLFTFTQQHYVEYYDLQSELVDHLANAIEMQWQVNPKCFFDEALNIEFNKFGVFGFMDVVEKRRIALSKKYNGLVWQHSKDFFGVPKIFLTVAMTLLLFTFIKLSLYKEWIIVGFYILLVGFTFYEMFRNRKTRKERKKSNDKKWLFESIINQYGTFSATIILPLNFLLQLINHGDSFLTNDYWILVISFLFVLFSLILFIVFKIIPSKVGIYLEATYPEYKFENCNISLI
ncbi:hypothetical protein RCH18_000521 [Flavobacterium sp. PL11]|uniref:hypothetical protein n=1 Tax=Flavobacterium sp. PL11 TaxID=3071717 RepID=UPI002DFC10E1|nr:hypothetical protein [Flavobacterium sp. PL11]